MWIGIVAVALLMIIIVYDLTQRHHAVLRNFPVIGHFRYLFESFGPELRQYIDYKNGWGLPSATDQQEIVRLMS